MNSLSIDRRNEIFSQEVLSTADIQELLNLPTASQASTFIGQIKMKSNLLDRKGYVHVMDYFIYFGIDPVGRYVPAQNLVHS